MKCKSTRPTNPSHFVKEERPNIYKKIYVKKEASTRLIRFRCFTFLVCECLFSFGCAIFIKHDMLLGDYEIHFYSAQDNLHVQIEGISTHFSNIVHHILLVVVVVILSEFNALLLLCVICSLCMHVTIHTPKKTEILILYT